MYQYSEEADNPGYGLVTIDGSSATPINPGFNNLETMLKNNVASGDGGYKTDLSYFSTCPAYSAQWNVKTGAGLPELPSGALTYMKNGAGPGPGLSGSGSQTEGDGSAAFVTQTAANAGYTTGAGGSSSSSSSKTGNAAAATVRPLELPIAALVSVAAVVFSSAFGVLLL